jgi:hypothetical protein
MGFPFTEHKIMIMLDQLRHKDTVILISYTKKLSLVVKWSFMAVHDYTQIMADKYCSDCSIYWYDWLIIIMD